LGNSFITGNMNSGAPSASRVPLTAPEMLITAATLLAISGYMGRNSRTSAMPLE